MSKEAKQPVQMEADGMPKAEDPRVRLNQLLNEAVLQVEEAKLALRRASANERRIRMELAGLSR